MHDKHGKALHVGDTARYPDGKEHHVSGYLTADGEVHHAPHKGSVAFAQDVELVKKHEKNIGRADITGDCIVWGNGGSPPPPPV